MTDVATSAFIHYVHVDIGLHADGIGRGSRALDTLNLIDGISCGHIPGLNILPAAIRRYIESAINTVWGRRRGFGLNARQVHLITIGDAIIQSRKATDRGRDVVDADYPLETLSRPPVPAARLANAVRLKAQAPVVPGGANLAFAAPDSKVSVE